MDSIKENYINTIKNQLQNNYLINIFSVAGQKLNFNKQTYDLLNQLDLNSFEYSQLDSIAEFCAEELTKKILGDNQYANFSNKDKLELKEIYLELFNKLREKKDIKLVETEHYNRILLYLKSTNDFLYNINNNEDKKVKTCTCSEYSYAFQLKLFNIELQDFVSPILDIGCGEHANLVNYLNENDKYAFGIERLVIPNKIIVDNDWLSYDYGVERWNTIFSNMSFSNHFICNYLQKRQIKEYSIVYLNILNSLKISGKWYYAPSIPFVEQLLDKNKYIIEIFTVDRNINRTTITKLK